MQIGFDGSRALLSTRTGTERYAYEIIRHLLRLPAAAAHGWRLYTGTPADAAAFGLTESSEPSAVDVCTLPSTRGWTHRALGPAVMRDAPDVLFVPAHVAPFALRPDRLPPTVVTVHDLGYRAYPETHTRRQRWYLEAGPRWSAHVAAQVICVSKATANDLHAHYGTPWEKIHVVYEAVGPTPKRLSEQALLKLRRDLGLERPFALYLGTIQPRKNLLRLIDAYAGIIQKTDPSWDLVLAGNLGWLSEAILARAQALGLQERIHFTGYVDEHTRIGLLQGACFFSFPSLHEGFGLPVLEAQQMGVPIMTSNKSSLPEVAGDAALLVDPTDVDAIAAAMLRLSVDETLRQELIAAGHENV